MGDAEGCGEDVPDGVEDECGDGLVYRIVCILAKQYIEKTEEGCLIFIEHKKTEMLRSDYSQLIFLLQAALGEIPKSVEKELDLMALLKLSQQQEIPTIALDGLQKLLTVYDGVLRQDVHTKAVKMQWIGSLMAQERRYAANYCAAKNLSELYDSNGICTYVLKGFSISQLYPVPSHRFSCDLDCFLLNKSEGCNAYESGNSLVASAGCNVEADYYKHSVFSYKGLSVENHRYCCSVKRSKRTRELERYLEGLLDGYTPQYIDDTKLALPPEMFQALFMIEHSNGHFLYSKMSIKHVCDWAMMRQAFKDTLDWKEFDKQCIRFGLKNFVDCLNHLVDYILGKCSYQDLRSIDKRVLDDTFKEVTLSKNLMKQRIEKAIGVLRSSWKFKHFCGDSMIKELSHSVWAYLREDKLELD